MSAKTDFIAKIRNAGGSHMASHSGALALAEEVWNIKQNVPETITAARTLTMADSGKIFLLSAAAGAQITLPAVADAEGFNAKFIIKTAFATTAWTIKAASNCVHGGAIVNSTFVAASEENLLTFAHAAETVGDFLNISACDGVGYYVDGVAAAAGGITFTAP